MITPKSLGANSPLEFVAYVKSNQSTIKTPVALPPGAALVLSPAFFYSITSSAIESRLSEIDRQSVFAVFKLIKSSNLLICWGKSEGFAPLRILAV